MSLSLGARTAHRLQTAGSQWTLLMTERYLAYAVSIGVKLFLLYLLMGVGQSIASTRATQLETVGWFSPNVYFEVIMSSIVFVMLTWLIPRTAAGLMAGAVSLAFSDFLRADAVVGHLAGGAAGATFGAIEMGRGAMSATIEAARFSGDSARSRGGGGKGAALGAIHGGGVLAAKALRQQWSGALIGADRTPKGTVADRIGQRRAELREKNTANATEQGNRTSEDQKTEKNTTNETRPNAVGNVAGKEEKHGAA